MPGRRSWVSSDAPSVRGWQSRKHFQGPSITSRVSTLLTKVIPAKNILFASEMISAVCIDATANLTVEERFLVYEGNARRVFPRLDAALKAQGR